MTLAPVNFNNVEKARFLAFVEEKAIKSIALNAKIKIPRVALQAW
jgi:hypothetical protein